VRSSSPTDRHTPTSAEYAIQPARPRDVSLLPDIELAAARLLAGHAPESVLTETTGEPELARAQAAGRLFVALAADEPVGFAHLTVLEPGAVHLEEVDVHPDHGRRRLGTRLVTAACDWARLAGYGSVTLTTFRDVPWNMPFYARLGFEEIGPREMGTALERVMRDEARRGLDRDRRVAMRLRLGPSPSRKTG